jgi:glyoxylase-like metal-dependent hydrolase (beta-lactamase superfamily II)
MKIQHFFDQRTCTLTYVVHDKASRIGVVIDPVLDFDPRTGRTWEESCASVAHYIDVQNLTIPYVLDTHVHADHLSGLAYFRSRYHARTVIGRHVIHVQSRFRDLFDLEPDFPVDGSQFDILLQDGDVLEVGSLSIKAIHTPGHTPACLTYQIGDALFVGDALFMPDYGTGRCDFPGGSAEILYESIRRLYALPDESGVFTCHDYQPGGRPLRYESTIGEERRANIHLNAQTTKDEFIALRKARDAALEMPALILSSLQVNIRGGRLPEPENNGVAYLKIPLNVFT